MVAALLQMDVSVFPFKCFFLDGGWIGVAFPEMRYGCGWQSWGRIAEKQDSCCRESMPEDAFLLNSLLFVWLCCRVKLIQNLKVFWGFFSGWGVSNVGPQWTLTIHFIVIHNRGSLSQVPWKEDAEGQIGFLTEWGIYLVRGLEKVEPPCLCGAAAWVPFICCRSSRVIEIQRRLHSGHVEGFSSCFTEQICSQGHIINI